MVVAGAPLCAAMKAAVWPESPPQLGLGVAQEKGGGQHELVRDAPERRRAAGRKGL
jgi:hypothetical protein